MKIAALTMVHRDHWALSRWYAHHGAQMGFGNLYVVAHGADPEIARLCPKASILTVPRDRFDDFDKRRAGLLNGIKAGLLQIYDWVIQTDADELVCFDPDRYAGLAAVFAGRDAPVLTALGFDVVERPGDPALGDAPVLAARRNIAFSGHYSKAVAARRGVDFRLHGTRVARNRLQSFPFTMPRGLFLAHLKFANRAALDAATPVRMQVGKADGTGLPGAGWQQADADAAQFFEAFAAKPERPWEEAEAQAYATLSVKPVRLEKRSVVKTRALKMPVRTRLPDRFSAQG